MTQSNNCFHNGTSEHGNTNSNTKQIYIKRMKKEKINRRKV